MKPVRPLLALLACLALATPAYADALDRDFPFSTGAATARVVDFSMPYTPVIKAYFPDWVDADDRARMLDALREHLDIIPPVHRAFVHEVVFDPGRYPLAAQAGARYKIANFEAAAIAMPHALVFYRNPPRGWDVTRRVVLHELGHVVAYGKFGSGAPPAAWTAAAKADGQFFSAYSRDAFYGSGTLTEDFADAYANFVGGKRFGGAEFDAFQATYPNRYRLLENYAY